MNPGAGRDSRVSSGRSTRLWIACSLALIALAGPSAQALTLTSRVVRSTPVVSNSLIVGRAVCQNVVWLLNEHLDLTQIAPPTLAVTTRAVGGFRRDERPWGLACLADGTIWTLSAPRAIARITAAGQVVDRRPLQAPGTALFATTDRLLLQSAPPTIGAALLGSSTPARPDDRRPWAGLLGRQASSRVDLLAHNLVNCGIGLGQELPCWLADEAQVVVSDGVHSRRLMVPFVQAVDIDHEAPIRDAALVERDRVWILGTAARLVSGRRAARRLFLSSGGREIARLDLAAEARLIVAADLSTCLLLTVDGQLVEVSAR